MSTDKLIAIAKKDLLEVRQNKSVWMPMAIVPFIFVIIIPLAMILLPTQLNISPESMTSNSGYQSFLKNIPPAMAAVIEGLNPTQSMIKLMLGYFFAPFFLIFPLMFSTVIAAESFAGERERKTMEALLYTSASDAELFLGKVLTALVPAIAISWLSFAGYTLVINAAGYTVFGQIWFPLPTWWPLIFWITPALALMGTSATVLISARTQTFMGAYQTSASLVLIPVALMLGQASGVLYLSVGVGLLVGGVCWLVAAGLTYLAIGGFHRFALLNQSV